MLSQFMGTRIFLKLMQTHFMEQRDVLIQNAVISIKTVCEELEISTERGVTRRKKYEWEKFRNVVLSLEHEVQRELFLSMDRIIKVKKERFDQVHILA